MFDGSSSSEPENGKDEGLGNGEVHHTVVSLWDVVSQEVEGFEFSVDR